MDFAKGLAQALVWLAVLGGIVAGFLRAFFVDVYTVPHNGMAPTTVYGDEVLVWRKATPDAGDIVLCEYPGDPATPVLSRVLALAGRTVSTDRMGNLFVDNNRAMKEGHGTVRFYDVVQEKLFEMELMSVGFGTRATHSMFQERGMPFELRTAEVTQGMFLLGDNLSSPENDSRAFGEVDPLTCKGQVFMRLKPAPKNDDDMDLGYVEFL
jgi:signal peptidase I